ncbi:nitroreductase family protein [Xanthobacter sp. TB0139]|uniref:nitroreductase family protein n=1 Tax=Xanthobacter sp. TB0139 TaxID=3459178 RepID=UPI0040392A78
MPAPTPASTPAPTSAPVNGASPDALDLLRTRRSFRLMDLQAPAPAGEDLETLLTIASRVPDHARLAPWRFILFEGDARARAGEVFARIWAQDNPEADEQRLKDERGRFLRSAMVIAVVFTPQHHPKIPEWEQMMSAAACCQNILLASIALGYGATWITEWPAFDARAREALGLSEQERVAGFMYVGTPVQKLEERPRPDLAKIVTRF